MDSDLWRWGKVGEVGPEVVVWLAKVGRSGLYL